MNWKDWVGNGRGLFLRYYLSIRLGRPRKTTKTSISIARRRGPDLNPGPSEYEAGVLRTRPRLSVLSPQRVSV